MTTAADSLVPIAYVAGAHGLNGEVRIKLLNPSSELLAPGRDILVRRAGADAAQRMAIRTARPHQVGSLLIAFAGCGDRNAAEALRGAELCVRRTELPALADDEYYLVDLIGLQAATADGKVVGNVVDVHEYPAAQTLRVGVAEGEIEIPLLAPYVTEIRLDERTVIVDHLEDLEVEPAARKRER